MNYLADIKTHLIEANDVLNRFIQDDKAILSVYKTAEMLSMAFDNNKKVISCGNGGSMSDAMHFAEELTGRYRNDRRAFPAIAISDPGHISCTANDYGYAYVFSRYLEAHGNSGDILFAISTSGNSENILMAAETAKSRGMKIIGLTGRDGGKLSVLSDVEIRVPHQEYADRIQEMHIKLIHIIIALVEDIQSKK
ncbi:MAG: D-sedoheptulose 7-phosphate isomerase [Bacteroidota bacterium]